MGFAAGGDCVVVVRLIAVFLGIIVTCIITQINFSWFEVEMQLAVLPFAKLSCFFLDFAQIGEVRFDCGLSACSIGYCCELAGDQVTLTEAKYAHDHLALLLGPDLLLYSFQHLLLVLGLSAIREQVHAVLPERELLLVLDLRFLTLVTNRVKRLIIADLDIAVIFSVLLDLVLVNLEQCHDAIHHCLEILGLEFLQENRLDIGLPSQNHFDPSVIIYEGSKNARVVQER